MKARRQLTEMGSAMAALGKIRDCWIGHIPGYKWHLVGAIPATLCVRAPYYPCGPIHGHDESRKPYCLKSATWDTEDEMRTFLAGAGYLVGANGKIEPQHAAEGGE
jgi:hypothetical protein